MNAPTKRQKEEEVGTMQPFVIFPPSVLRTVAISSYRPPFFFLGCRLWELFMNAKKKKKKKRLIMERKTPSLLSSRIMVTLHFFFFGLLL